MIVFVAFFLRLKKTFFLVEICFENESYLWLVSLENQWTDVWASHNI